MVRKQVLVSQVRAWPKVEKGVILDPDHLCAVNGWHRDHARKMSVARSLATARLPGSHTSSLPIHPPSQLGSAGLIA